MTNQELEKNLDVALKALEFYASGNHFSSNGDEWIKPGKYGYDDPIEIEIHDDGATAREAIKTIKGHEG